ncbi:hypothetical protein B7494_g1913 [Chlorociboria aeruginascens]|nr:hypothetical protein B7494_g1913 [Chlorociboria aeruginascens]
MPIKHTSYRSTRYNRSAVSHDIDDFPETAQRLRLAEQEPLTSDPMCPRTSSSSRASSEPLHDHIGTADHYTLVRSALNSNIFNEEDRQRQEEEQEEEDYDNDNEGGRQPQQEVKEGVAAALMTGKIGGTHLSSKKNENLGLGYHDPSPEPSHDKLGSHSDSCNDDEFSNTLKSDGEEIHHALPDRILRAIQVQYSTKLKK